MQKTEFKIKFVKEHIHRCSEENVEKNFRKKKEKKSPQVYVLHNAHKDEFQAEQNSLGEHFHNGQALSSGYIILTSRTQSWFQIDWTLASLVKVVWPYNALDII
ncbi:hypothetical protein ANTRET_LOCUS1929 [Anthophora retusa]